MSPHHFDEANCVYRGTDDLPCEDMWALRKDGKVTSRWRPDMEELRALMNGGSVELTILGGQPPVRLRVV